MLFQTIHTDRLTLKIISSDDRDFILSHFSNNTVNEYLFDSTPPITLQDADNIIAPYIIPEPRTQCRWILVRKEDGTKIGTCGFHCWNPADNCCEIGYDLHPAYWGKGYMTEALNTIISFAESQMKINQIRACIYPQNIDSVNLAKKLGFEFQGQIKEERFKGKSYPHKIYVYKTKKP